MHVSSRKNHTKTMIGRQSYAMCKYIVYIYIIYLSICKTRYIDVYCINTYSYLWNSSLLLSSLHMNKKNNNPKQHIWVFPKIMVPPNHPFVHRVFHEIFTIHFGGKSSIFGNIHIPRKQHLMGKFPPTKPPKKPAAQKKDGSTFQSWAAFLATASEHESGDLSLNSWRAWWFSWILLEFEGHLGIP